MPEISPYFNATRAKELSEQFLKDKDAQINKVIPEIKTLASDQWYEYIATNIINAASNSDKRSIIILFKHYCSDEILRKLRLRLGCKNITDNEFAQFIKNEIINIAKDKGFNIQLLDSDLNPCGIGINISISW
jgi:hypothetical protein